MGLKSKLFKLRISDSIKMFRLDGKTAFVTGSSQGIGKAIASLLAKQGAKVFVHASNSMEKAQKAASEMQGNTACVVGDLSKPDEVENLYKQTGDVDILVLNASAQIRNPWDLVTADEMEMQLGVNVKANYRLIQLYQPAMKAKGWGRIVTIGSVQQKVPHKDMPLYAASKCAVMSIVENLAKQFAPFGITVNNMSPGVIDTPRNAAALSDAEYSKKVMAGIPMGYAGRPEDCAPAVLLICSDEGRYITGTDLIVDGGMGL